MRQSSATPTSSCCRPSGWTPSLDCHCSVGDQCDRPERAVRHYRLVHAPSPRGAGDRDRRGRFWCEPELVGSDQAPFPFWIFTRSPLEYWRGLLRFRALEEIPRRVEYLLGERPARARADGYWDYEPTYVAGGYATNPARRADIERRSDDYISNITGEFAAARQLKQLVGTLPPATSLVLVFPPLYHTLLPSAGTKGASAARDCKGALMGALAGHPNAAVLDWRVDRAEVRRAEWFFDHSHYRHPVAELIEKDVAAALRQLPRAIP
jgi:hypothetical protein